MGYSIGTAFSNFIAEPAIGAASQMSSPPMPPQPEVAKNRVPSYRMRGNISSAAVFTVDPMFTGAPNASFFAS